MRIGVFDSGLGGVNVLASLIKKYPHHEYIYFGDTKNLPYGDKTKEELMNLASGAINFLLTKNVDLIIIACGTISSNCYSELKEKYNILLYDVISPTIKYLRMSNYYNIGVIGTKRTIESKIFNIPGKNILAKETPSLVPIIENNQINEKKNEIIDELNIFKNSEVLVLGCTHYPLIRNIIQYDLSIPVIDMGEILANSLNIPDGNSYSCELYFSSISTNLVINIENILSTSYQIYLK